MDGALIPCPAALTGVAVAGEDRFAVAAEPLARVRCLPVAPAAQPGDGGIRPATVAEQAGLGEFQQGSV